MFRSGEPPLEVNPIWCKWVFKKKTDMDGKVHTYDAWLIANGYKKYHGVDYDKTFSLVVMLKSARVLLVISMYHDYKIC